MADIGSYVQKATDYVMGSPTPPGTDLVNQPWANSFGGTNPGLFLNMANALFGQGAQQRQQEIVTGAEAAKLPPQARTPEQSAAVANLIANFPGLQGTLGSVKAAMADLPALRNAKIMEGPYATPEETWRATGWNASQFADQRPRFEIDDSKATVNHELRGNVCIAQNRKELDQLDSHLAQLMDTRQTVANKMEDLRRRGKPFSDEAKDLDYYDNMITKKMNQLNNYVSLPDILKHPELYKQYPHLENYIVSAIKNGRGGNQSANASVSPWDKEINLNIMANKDPEQMRSSLLHEVQHAIDHYEGHPSYGTSSAGVPWENYYNNYGEVLARNTSRRRDMTAAERVATPPWKSYDVPLDDQLIRRAIDRGSNESTTAPDPGAGK